MVARARQFSSFILLVGSIASADVFLPKYAIIIKNKDDLKIPLMLEQIPTPKVGRVWNWLVEVLLFLQSAVVG